MKHGGPFVLDVHKGASLAGALTRLNLSDEGEDVVLVEEHVLFLVNFQL